LDCGSFDSQFCAHFQLVHEICHQVAAYRQMVQSIGTQSDGQTLRKELHQLRKNCLRQADATKAIMLPQLKEFVADFV
jgi:hypothetical protein